MHIWNWSVSSSGPVLLFVSLHLQFIWRFSLIWTVVRIVQETSVVYNAIWLICWISVQKFYWVWFFDPTIHVFLFLNEKLSVFWTSQNQFTLPKWCSLFVLFLSKIPCLSWRGGRGLDLKPVPEQRPALELRSPSWTNYYW